MREAPQNEASSIFPALPFLAALSFLPLSATLAPRAMVFLPGLIALGYMAWLWARKHSVPLPSRMTLALTLTPALLGTLSALWSADPGQALERALKASLTLGSGAFLIGIAHHQAQQNLRRLCWIPALAVAAASLALASDLAMGLPVTRAAAGVPPSAEFDPFHVNRGVVVCTLLFFPALGFAFLSGLKRREKTFLCMGLFLCCALLLALCESQSAQLALCCGVLTFALYPVIRPRAGKVALWGCIALFLCAAPWLAQAAFRPLATAIEAREHLRELSAPQRLEIWDFVARRALESPVLGFGIDATRDMTFDTASLYHEGSTVLHPHDFALQIWIEFGALGVACALVFFAALIRTLNRMPEPAARFAVAGFVTSLSVAATGYGIWQGWWLGTLTAQTAWIALMGNAAAQCRSDSGASGSETWSSGTTPSARSASVSIDSG